MINKFFKKKLTLSGYHEIFCCIKQIGKVNFAHIDLAKNLFDEKFYAVKAVTKEALRNQKNGLVLKINLNNNIKIYY